MRGALALVRTARSLGATVWFANPGTTEMPLVTALDEVPGTRAVLGLFEGVCTGAADGYGRMTDRPAVTLLHLGPGLANGLANLHNARRARSPVLNVVGDHTTWHRDADAPLTSDIAALAGTVSAEVRSSRRPDDLARDFAALHARVSASPGCVGTLIAPADCQWAESGPPPAEATLPRPEPRQPPAERVAEALRRLRSATRPVLLVGGLALREEGLAAAARVAAATGARLVCETFPARLERGAGRPAVERLGYFPEQALAQLAGVDLLLLAGAREPVAFFGYPDAPSRLVPEGCGVATLASDAEDPRPALRALADELGAPVPRGPDAPRPEAPASGPLDPASLGAVLAALQPEGAIVVDEGATSALPHFVAAAGSRPHTWLGLTGGAIGQGLPCAAGAALACPGRRVIALEADGSALYTLQALHTHAREGLDVTTVLCSNRRYRILQVELARAGVAEPGPVARDLTSLDRPPLDWVALARGQGVPAARAETVEAFREELSRALAAPGPSLIEAVL